MFEYLKGTLQSITPASAVIDIQGIGYNVQITLQSFTHLQGKESALLYIHEVIREDAHTLYGFVDTTEREVFRALISVSGVGSNTARMMLSSLSSGELIAAITHEKVDVLKNIKGIGPKTAQRIIIDLKDKVAGIRHEGEILFRQNNTHVDEALSALVALGFAKAASEKVLAKIMAQEPSLRVEEFIKQALKQL